MTREEVARDLARWHFTVESQLRKILWIKTGAPENENEPVRLLEVATERGGMERGIEVFAFDKTNDVPYPTEVAEITERELTLIVAGVLSLPEGWTFDDVKTFTREELGVPVHESAAE